MRNSDSFSEMQSGTQVNKPKTKKQKPIQPPCTVWWSLTSGIFIVTMDFLWSIFDIFQIFWQIFFILFYFLLSTLRGSVYTTLTLGKNKWHSCASWSNVAKISWLLAYLTEPIQSKGAEVKPDIIWRAKWLTGTFVDQLVNFLFQSIPAGLTVRFQNCCARTCTARVTKLPLVLQQTV